MKILFIHKHHFKRDGTTTYYFALAKLLKKHGHTVAFFSTRNARNIPSRWSNYFPAYHDLNEPHAWWTSLKLPFSLIYNREAKKNLGQLLDEFKPDIAHLHNIYYHLTPSVIDALQARNIPMVMTLQDYQLICPNYSLFVRDKIWEKSKPHKFYWCIIDKCVKNSYIKSFAGAMEALVHYLRDSYKPVSIFLSPSVFLKHKYEEYGFKGKIVALWNPLDIVSIHRRLAVKPAEKKDYFLYHGRLSREKGLPVLIEAVASTRDTMLKIVGEGPERKPLEKLVRTLKLQKRVQFLGFKQGRALENLIRGAKAIVLPSIWYESYGYTVAEGMAWGKLVIASRIGGIPEIIDDKKNGLLFTPGDAKELAALMSSLDTYDVKGMERAALEKSNQFDGELFYKKLLPIYEQVLTA